MNDYDYRCWSVGLQRRVDLSVRNNDFEEHTASVFVGDDVRPGNGGCIYLRNFGIFLQVHMALQPKLLTLTSLPP